MKNTLLTLGIGALIGGTAVYFMKPQPVPSPTQPSAGVWPIPKPSAGYAEQNYPNVHKNLGPAPFYEPEDYDVEEHSNGSLIFID